MTVTVRRWLEWHRWRPDWCEEQLQHHSLFVIMHSWLCIQKQHS